jgi:xanthine dehydrogenase large subunit
MSQNEPGQPSLRHVRQPLPHDSAFKHVQGSADYIDDMPEPQGTLHVAVGGSPVARGRIVQIDLGKVRAFGHHCGRYSRQERCFTGQRR